MGGATLRASHTRTEPSACPAHTRLTPAPQLTASAVTAGASRLRATSLLGSKVQVLPASSGATRSSIRPSAPDPSRPSASNTCTNGRGGLDSD